MKTKTIIADTADKRFALIAALTDRIAKLTPMIGSGNTTFDRMFGQEIVDLKAMLADLQD